MLGTLALGGTALLGLNAYSRQVLNANNGILNGGTGLYRHPPPPARVPEPNVAAMSLLAIGGLMVLGLRKKE